MKQSLPVVIALVVAGTLVAAQNVRDPQVLFKAAQHTELVQGDLRTAIAQYQRVVAAGDRALAAQALVRMADCYQKLGDAQSQAVYEVLVRDYSDQREAAATARLRLAARRPAVTPVSRKTTRQIWSGLDVDGGGSPSPDGRYLSFTDWETGDLAIRDLTAGATRRLTNTGGWVASGDYADESVISPDGQQVAYAWFIEKEFKNELRVASLALDTPRLPRSIVRTARTDQMEPMAWTPDGRQLIVARSFPDGTNQIGAITVQDGSYRSIKSLGWRYPDRVTLSPDGRFLAYDVPAGDNGSPRDIFVLAIDGTRDGPLVQGSANDSSPVWSPDGSHVLFLSDRTGNVSLWGAAITSGLAQGPPVQMKDDLGRVSLLGMARNGALFYFVGGSARRNVYVAEIEENRVTRPPVLGADSFVNANTGPAWSRDGQYLAYYSFRTQTMLVIRTTTGAERVVPLPAGVATPFNSGPKWFPDNQAVLILSRDAQGSGFGFFRLTLASGNLDLLWHHRLSPSSFDLSPDGRSIFAAFQTDGEPQDGPLHMGRLTRYDIESRKETDLKSNEWFIGLAVSPDGTELAYLKSVRSSTTEYPSVLEVMPTSGGPARQVYRDAVWLDGSRYNSLTWTADRRFLLFVRGGERTQSVMWRVPVDGSAAEQFGITSSARIKSPNVHPNGRQIAFASIETATNEVAVLENFLPALKATSMIGKR